MTSDAVVAGAWRQRIARAYRQPQMRWGSAITTVVVLVALVGPFVAPHDPAAFVARPFSPPSAEVLLGADSLGRDVLSRVLDGGFTVLWMSLVASLLGTAGGVALGLVAGYSGGVVDGVIMRLFDVLIAFPQIVLMLLFVTLLGSNVWLVVLLVGIGWMPGVARVTRGLALEVSQREYVQAAAVFGLPKRQILLREILPNISTPLFVEFGLRLTWSIAVIAGLSYLGLGIQPPQADWGLMINENRTGLVIQPWGVVVPVILIAICTVGTNLIADGISRTIAGVDRPGGTR